MARYNILVYTWHHALVRMKTKAIDATWLQSKDVELRAVQVDYPTEAAQAKLVVKEDIQESPPLEPWEEISVELTQTGELIRILPNTLEAQVEERGSAIRALIRDAILDNPETIQNVTAICRKWMLKGAIVRVIGAGRALLAASLPANRLSHGGAAVSLIGDKAPLPNSHLGGGIIAASASGEARSVIEDMERADNINNHRLVIGEKPLVIVGISTNHAKAEKFRSLCTPGYYIGLRKEPEYVTCVTLRGLADLEEFAISELLDALVVRAGTEIGCNFKGGHEDCGPTGPHHQHSSQH